jgi:integrase
MRLEEWTERWVEVYGIAWADNTLTQRADMLHAHIDPFIGGVKLRDLGRKRIQTYRRDLIVSGRSPKTVNAAIRVLSASLTNAAEERLIPANPCHRLRPLPTDGVNREAIPLDAVEAIRVAMPTGRDRLIVSLLCYAGLRPQEVRALRAESVTGGGVVVNAATSRTGRLKGTKTGATRIVPIREELRRDLHEGRSSGLLVPADRGGPILWQNWASRVWRPIVGAGTTEKPGLGLRHPPYAGRHTYASLLIAEGVSIVEVAARLGHASPTTTLAHYAHLFESHRMAG